MTDALTHALIFIGGYLMGRIMGQITRKIEP